MRGRLDISGAAGMIAEQCKDVARIEMPKMMCDDYVIPRSLLLPGSPFANLSDITNIPVIDIYGIHLHVWQILMSEWIILYVRAQIMKGCLEVVKSDSFTENQLNSFEQ